MQKMMVMAGLAALVMAGSTGCKSAPKLAFWKSGDKPDVESTAIAHSAPALPADIAKEAESLASMNPAIEMSASAPASTAGMAAPFTPSSTAPAMNSTPVTAAASAPVGYPSTGATAYSQTPATVAAANSSTPSYYTADTNADLGAIEMPYNPNAVPPAKNLAATQPTTPVTTPESSADRYALANTAPGYGQDSSSQPPAASDYPPSYNTGDRYSSYQPQSTDGVPGAAPNPDMNLASMTSPTSVTPTTPTTGDRYSMAPTVNPTSPMNMTTSPVATSSPTTPTPTTVANASPYRPGGTSTYESGSAAVEVATRPKVTEPFVPNVATPSTTTAPGEAPRYR